MERPSHCTHTCLISRWRCPGLVFPSANWSDSHLRSIVRQWDSVWHSGKGVLETRPRLEKPRVSRRRESAVRVAALHSLEANGSSGFHPPSVIFQPATKWLREKVLPLLSSTGLILHITNGTLRQFICHASFSVCCMSKCQLTQHIPN